MATVYRIKDYQTAFENGNSLQYKHLKYVCIPNDCDSIGYRRIMRLKNGCRVYCVFLELVKMVSRQPIRYDRNGYLTKSGYKDSEPYSINDIADKIGFSVDDTAESIDVLASEQIGWLIIENIGPVENRQNLAKFDSEQNRTEQNRTTKTLGHSTKDFVQKFDEWYAHYPKKVGKAQALKAFKKLKPSDELVATMIDAVKAQCKSDNWRKDNGQFIPHPSTWLNGKRWEDESAVVIRSEPGHHQSQMKPLSKEDGDNLPW